MKNLLLVFIGGGVGSALRYLVAMVLLACAPFCSVDGQTREGAALNDGVDPIGLSGHVRHLRGDADSAIVTTGHGGWTVDSVRIFEDHYKNYTKPYLHRMFYISKCARKRMAKGKPFVETFRWLTMKTTDKVLVFGAERSWELRRATVYLHKGNHVDSVRLTQSEAPWAHTDIYLWPNTWTFPACGGMVEATIRGTACRVKDISMIKDVEDGTAEQHLPKTEMDDGIDRQPDCATCEYVSVETAGNVVMVTVSPNSTEKCRSFVVELQREEVADGKTRLQTDRFYGMQNAETEKCFLQNFLP